MNTDEIVDNPLLHASFLYTNVHPNKYFDQFKPYSKTKMDHKALKERFFSEKNIKKISNEIIKDVYKKSCNKWVISPQKHEHILAILTIVFDNMSLNYRVDIESQIEYLNKLTVDTCTENIIKQIKSRQKAKDHFYSKFYTMPDPESSNIKGTKSHMPVLSQKYARHVSTPIPYGTDHLISHSSQKYDRIRFG